MVRISTTKFALLCFTIFGISAMHILFSCDDSESRNSKQFEGGGHKADGDEHKLDDEKRFTILFEL